MRKVGIISNPRKDTRLEYTKSAVEQIIKGGGKAFLKKDVQDKIGIKCDVLAEGSYNEVDIIICLGGDGTLIKTVRETCKFDIPVLGINLGNLGFLTEIETKEINDAIRQVLLGKYVVQSRMILSAQVFRENKPIFKDIAVNDVTLSRVALSRILPVLVYLDEQFVDFFPGDGIIVSTPTGSTAYTLSAGGPIVQPDMDLIITTPICPHTLYSRSFITAKEKRVKLVIAKNYFEDAMLTIDGQIGFNLKAADIIEVSNAPYYFRFARVKNINFYKILRAKIHSRAGINGGLL